MSLVGKLVSELSLNVGAEKFYKIFKHQCSNVPEICPDWVQKVEIHNCDWDKHCNGSIKTWYYTVDGKPEVFKERVEFDDQNLYMSMTGLEGDVFKHYKSFKSRFHVVPKGPNHSLAILTLEYEKFDDGSPYPYKYLDVLNNVTKDIESHLK